MEINCGKVNYVSIYLCGCNASVSISISQYKTGCTIEKTSNKLAEPTLIFWTIKIVATTQGETIDNALSILMYLGYSVPLFLEHFFCDFSAQIKEKQFHSFFVLVKYHDFTNLR